MSHKNIVKNANSKNFGFVFRICLTFNLNCASRPKIWSIIKFILEKTQNVSNDVFLLVFPKILTNVNELYGLLFSSATIIRILLDHTFRCFSIFCYNHRNSYFGIRTYKCAVRVCNGSVTGGCC